MKALLLTTAFLMASVTLHAEDQTPVIVEKKYEIEKDSSEHNRMSKKFEASVILLGNGPNATLHSSGLSLGYYFDLNKIIILEGTGSTNVQDGNVIYSSSSTNSSSSHQFLKVNSYGLHFKHFTGNSFYYRLGIDHRTVDYKYRFQSEEAGFKGDSTALSLYIGNQWQWNNFTLGCDWVGLSAPLTSQVKDEYLNNAAQSDSYFYDTLIKRDSDHYVKNINVNLLRFYLGASF